MRPIKNREEEEDSTFVILIYFSYKHKQSGLPTAPATPIFGEPASSGEDLGSAILRGNDEDDTATISIILIFSLFYLTYP